MGLLSDFKKLLFVKKAVTKSAIQKVVNAGEELPGKAGDALQKVTNITKETGNQVVETAGEAVVAVKDIAEEFGQKSKEKVQTSRESTPSPSDEIMDEIIAETESNEEETSTRTASDPITESAEDTFGKAKEFAKNAGEKAKLTGKEILDKLEGTATSVGETVRKKSSPVVEKAKDVLENVGDKALDAGEKFVEKFGEASETVGGAVLEKSGEALEKAKGLAENIGAKILKARDELVEKAQEEAAKTGDSADNLVDKAKEMAAELEDKIAGETKNPKALSSTPPDVSSSELDKHGSFWEKAEHFAEGDYQMEGKGETPKEGEMKIQKDPDFVKKPKEGKVKGFEDLDGDGDELIDDAIIDED